VCYTTASRGISLFTLHCTYTTLDSCITYTNTAAEDRSTPRNSDRFSVVGNRPGPRRGRAWRRNTSAVATDVLSRVRFIANMSLGGILFRMEGEKKREVNKHLLA